MFRRRRPHPDVNAEPSSDLEFRNPKIKEPLVAIQELDSSGLSLEDSIVDEHHNAVIDLYIDFTLVPTSRSTGFQRQRSGW
jgi:hypothetical protein